MSVVVTTLQIMKTAVSNVFGATEMDISYANVYPTKQILEIFGNILAEDDNYCDVLLNNGMLEMLHSVYFDERNTDMLLKQEVLFCWMNIAGGRFSQVLFNSINVRDLIANVYALQQSQTDIDYEMARRSMVIVCNFICECDDNVSELDLG